MKKEILIIVLLGFTVVSFGQTIKRKSLDQLINNQEPAWDLVMQWIKEAKNVVEILPKEVIRADSALYQAQVTTRSPMGAIIYETGGLLIDNGWIRILGSGSKRLNRSLMEWNRGKSFENEGEQPSFLLIADDVLGGFFAINAGGLDTSQIGKVFYFSPDNLKWESLELSFTEFINFCLNADLNIFYEGYRWNNWKKDIDTLDGNLGMSIFPYLFTKEGKDINNDNRAPVPIQELWNLYVKEEHK